MCWFETHSTVLQLVEMMVEGEDKLSAYVYSLRRRLRLPIAKFR